MIALTILVRLLIAGIFLAFALDLARGFTYIGRRWRAGRSESIARGDG